ncbi:DEP domain-containing mTOR-interacting protein-like [Dysidea avara]|uniref:DEP domain-containing mTOR-interacting protein-like n=1 Tax=Dysidea avara TaxID=196820 RepID=UPI00332B80E5
MTYFVKRHIAGCGSHQSLTILLRILRHCREFKAGYVKKACGMSTDNVREDNFVAPLTRAGSVSSITSSDSGSISRRKMSTVRSLNKEAVLALGEDLRQTLHECPGMIKDRRYHLKTYSTCFVGNDLITWLVERKEVETRKDGVTAMQKLQDNGVIHHVCDDHGFKDEKLFYRFRRDDNTYAGPLDAPLVAKAQRLYSRIRTSSPGLIADRKYHLHTYKQCIIGREFVDWLIVQGDVKDREEALEFGKKLVKAGVIRHVCDDHDFKDDYLFYRFRNDDKVKDKLELRKLLSGSPKIDKKSQPPTPPERKKSNKNSKIFKGEMVYASPDEAMTSKGAFLQGGEVVPSIEEEDEYMVMKPADEKDDPTYVQMHSAVSQANVLKDKLAVGTGGGGGTLGGKTFTNSPNPGRKIIHVDDLLHQDAPFVQREVTVVSDPVGYGFVIRGNSPVYVHSVDPMGPAAAAGLQIGEFLYAINGQTVLQSSHQEAAKIILMGPSSTHLSTLCPHHLCP